jgi:membrane dipeptidase
MRVETARMAQLGHTDHHSDPEAWAAELGISREAVELHLASDVIDLHLDSFIWTRVFGYDLLRRHGNGLFGGAFYSQVDFPRALEAGITGATWIITTNPLRSAEGRARAFVNNIKKLRAIFEAVPEQFSLVRTAAEYDAARAAGKHGAFIGIQGGNALDRDLDALDLIPDQLVLRITLVHLSSSSLGTTSSPLKTGSDCGLTDHGRDYVRRLNEKKIFVDLAHASKRAFWDAVEIHDRSQPLLVTHTGISAVHEHWRNLDDAQIRAVAETGGTIGIMYQSSFLGDPVFSGRADSIVRHAEHVIQTVGDDHVSLGSDFDGAITPPADLRSCLELPRLTEHMLARGWSSERIQKVLGKNFLRVVRALRG